MPRPGANQPRLDRERVVRAAADLVNAEGAGALTINRLARELNVQPPSLYNHVDGLEDLQRKLALLNAHRLGECITQAAVGQTGAPAVRSVAQAYRAYILQNPGLYFASLRASGNQPQPDAGLQEAEARIVQVVLAILKPFGLSGEDALHAVRGLRSLVHGFASLEASGGFGLPLECDESFRRLVEMFVRGMGNS